MNRAIAASVVVFSLVGSACQPTVQRADQPKTVSSAALLGAWELVSIDGIAMPAKKVSVTFRSEGAFTAMLDCNNARGFYSFSGAELSFNGWYSTERGCVPPLQHEDLIVDALIAHGYAVAFATSSELHLSGKHNVVFRRV
ncbi:MAG: META domain-containing protein [Sphingomicrobium sp.]